MIYPAVDDLVHGVLVIFLIHTLAHESSIGQRRRRKAILHYALLPMSVALVIV